MKCREVMTDNPTCCLPHDLVNQVARVMRREHIGAVPVVSDEHSRELIGIITDRDLAIKVVAESRDPGRTIVSDVMSHTIVVWTMIFPAPLRRWTNIKSAAFPSSIRPAAWWESFRRQTSRTVFTPRSERRGWLKRFREPRKPQP